MIYVLEQFYAPGPRRLGEPRSSSVILGVFSSPEKARLPIPKGAKKAAQPYRGQLELYRHPTGTRYAISERDLDELLEMNTATVPPKEGKEEQVVEVSVATLIDIARRLRMAEGDILHMSNPAAARFQINETFQCVKLLLPEAAL